MSETLPKTTPEAASEIDKLNAMLDAPSYEAASTEPANTAEVEDSRELSPTGSLLSRAADRINSLSDTLHQRALDKAHGEALEEYKERDYNGYIDQLSATKDSDNNSEEAREYTANELSKEERRADREARRDAAKEKIRGFGISALRRLKATGEITLGLTLIGAEKAKDTAYAAKDIAAETVAAGAQAVKNGAEAVATTAKDAAQRGLEATSEKISDTWAAAEELAGKAGAKAEVMINNGIESATYTVEAAKQAVEYRRQAAVKKKEEALTRKYARHARWFNLKRDARARAEEFIDDTQEKAEDAKRAVKIRTSAGRRALLAYREAVDVHK